MESWINQTLKIDLEAWYFVLLFNSKNFFKLLEKFLKRNKRAKYRSSKPVLNDVFIQLSTNFYHSYIYIYIYIYIIFTNPSARAGYDTRSIFKRSLTGSNSEFSFSWIYIGKYLCTYLYIYIYIYIPGLT